MYMMDLIHKKKQGIELNSAELEFIVQGITQGTIPDYQITAWAMAVCFQGMKQQELYYFTKAVINSGQTINLSAIKGFTVDKHSTGGIGDKTSLVFGPVAASCGLKVSKMSGRGLGITGGTIDKLETIPGFKVDLSVAEFINVVNTTGMSIISQTGDLVPADKKLYALRDVSGTVDSLPLIAASIMSKKIAMGADLILLDVKCGKGAFVQDLKTARKLAKLMVNLGKDFNKRVSVVISDMNKPLGKTIGNTLEIQEALLSLQNQGPADLKQLVATLVGLALVSDQQAKTLKQGIVMANAAFTTPKPLDIFYQFVQAQGGDLQYLKQIYELPPAHQILKVVAPSDGYLNFTDNYLLGELSVLLGAGRMVKDDRIDSMAGIVLQATQGVKVVKGQTIMELHTNKDLNQQSNFLSLANQTFQVSSKKVKIQPLILEIIM